MGSGGVPHLPGFAQLAYELAHNWVVIYLGDFDVGLCYPLIVQCIHVYITMVRVAPATVSEESENTKKTNIGISNYNTRRSKLIKQRWIVTDWLLLLKYSLHLVSTKSTIRTTASATWRIAASQQVGSAWVVLSLKQLELSVMTGNDSTWASVPSTSSKNLVGGQWTRLQ